MQSTRVSSFKVPTEKELSHDFLWRVHQQAPAKSEIAIFNRSHYEDVLVVRVHDLVPKAVWKARYDQINQFESLLAAASTIIVKFYLHIDRAEQEKRLLEREAEPEKSWKLSVGDWKERDFWDDYTAAYEDALSRCTTPDAPWHIVPANRKWFRNLAVTQAIVDALRPFERQWVESLTQMGVERKAELAEFRKSQAG